MENGRVRPLPEIAKLRGVFPLRWSMERRFRLPSSEPNQPYYIYYPGTLKPDQPWKVVGFDDRGVIVTPIGYNPVTIAQYALYAHERMLRAVPDSEEAFLAQARYLVERQRDDGGYPFDVAEPQYGAGPGFLSAMAQGTAASALVRAFLSTNDTIYREAAIRSARPLRHDVAEGGASYIRGDAVFFEEVACPGACHILNGHLFAAFGIWDLCRLGFGDAELHELHEAAIRTLLRWLPFYEDRGWSYYQLGVRKDSSRHYAHISYQHLHIAQLHVYAAMTGREEFEATAHRWEDALNRLSARARVWADSASWALEMVRERLGLERREPWRPMELANS